MTQVGQYKKLFLESESWIAQELGDFIHSRSFAPAPQISGYSWVLIQMASYPWNQRKLVGTKVNLEDCFYTMKVVYQLQSAS